MTPVFLKTLMGEGYDESTGMALDSHGNILLAGTFRKSLDFDPGPESHVENASGSDEFGFIGKYDSQGAIAWVHVYKSYLRGNSKHGDIAVDAQDNIIVTGVCKGTVDLGFGIEGGIIPSASGWAAFVAKYGPDGTFKWAVPITAVSGTGYPKPENLAVSESGEIILSGTLSGKIDFDPSDGESVVESKGNYSSGFVVKYSTDGTLGWFLGIPNAGKMLIASGPDKSVGIAGTFYDSTIVPGGQVIYSDSRFGSRHSSGMFVGVLEANGDLRWIDEYGASTNTAGGEDVASVKIAENGTVYVAGRYNGEFRVGDTVLSDTLRYQLYWASFDEQGNLLNAFSHALDTWPKRMQISESGALYIAGNCFEDTLAGIAHATFFISRYSPSDTVVWLGKAQGASLDNLIDFALLDDRHVLITGYTYDSESADRDPFFGKWLLENSAGIEESPRIGGTILKERVRAVKGRELIVDGIGENTGIVLMNLGGARVLYSSVSSVGITRIPLSSLSAGVYLARFAKCSSELPPMRIRVGF